jgi:5-methylcytosine-specific restriction endonuclease McrA
MGYKDPSKNKEYYERTKQRQSEQSKEYYEINKEEINRKHREHYEQNKEKYKERNAKNKDRRNETNEKLNEERKQHVIYSISVGEIVDLYKWDMWCKKIRNGTTKHPYSADFTNDIIFEKMLQKCFYCGDIPTGIDRIDSKLTHTPDNCVACCVGCNKSKGAADPSTFIRKAYYRARGKYIDDDNDIWFVNKQKPRIDMYKRSATKKGVSFDLSKEDFDVLITGDCEYFQRSPTTWFGIDRMVPSLGYVLGNAVSCCFDCNVDKFEDDVGIMRARNERIFERVAAGGLVIKECEKRSFTRDTRYYIKS